MEPTISNAALVDPARLDDFLTKQYSPDKAESLKRYGAWFHRGNENRFLLVLGDEIIGQTATTPSKLLMNGRPIPALWWMEVMISPQYRGRGWHNILDKKIRSEADLLVGVPGALLTKIIKTHGWGVREDYCSRVFPIRPHKISAQRTGFRGLVHTAGAQGLRPFAAWMRWRLGNYQPVTARIDPAATPESIAAIFERTITPEFVTSYRDAAFCKWRFFDAPYRPDLTFYVAGPAQAPTLCLIARRIATPEGYVKTRLLDLFGDLNDTAGLQDILKLATRDAIRRGDVQISLMVSVPEIERMLAGMGYWIRNVVRFCWSSPKKELMTPFEQRGHWTYIDSDCDPLTDSLRFPPRATTG